MKPIPYKAYGSIPHLFGSCATGDKFVGSGQHTIATTKTRDTHDTVIVQEKLDGANVAILSQGGALIPISRSGNRCAESTYTQHRIFHEWVMQHYDKFGFLQDGERLCGEWLIMAHGTMYAVKEPFIAFDIMKGHERLTFVDFQDRLPAGFPRPALLQMGEPMSIETAMEAMGEYGKHGALERTEGAVWRVERNCKVEFMAKYLRRDASHIGKYLKEERWNVDVAKFRKNLPWSMKDECV